MLRWISFAGTFLSALCLSGVIFVQLQAGEALSSSASSEVVLGNGLSAGEFQDIGMLLDSPSDWIDKAVRVEGTVTEVCQMMGCWIQISDDQKRSIRIKVDDGVIVFPDWAPGHRIRAEGTLQRLQMEREAYIAYREHEADERGLEFDASTIGDPPYEIVRIWGSGAIIDKGSD